MLVSMCQDIMKLVSKLSDKNKDNTMLVDLMKILLCYKQKIKVWIRCCSVKLPVKFFLCIQRALKFYKVQVGGTCLQIWGSLIQRTHCMTAKYNLPFILPHCHYPLVLNVSWSKQLPSSAWKIKNWLLTNQTTSILPIEIKYIPSSELPLVRKQNPHMICSV